MTFDVTIISCMLYLLGTELLFIDLVVVFDTHFNFHGQMKALAASCCRRLGFVMSNAREFDDPNDLHRSTQLRFSCLKSTRDYLSLAPGENPKYVHNILI